MQTGGLALCKPSTDAWSLELCFASQAPAHLSSLLNHLLWQPLRQLPAHLDCGRAACLPLTHGRRMRIRRPSWYVGCPVQLAFSCADGRIDRAPPPYPSRRPRRPRVTRSRGRSMTSSRANRKSSLPRCKKKAVCARLHYMMRQRQVGNLSEIT